MDIILKYIYIKELSMNKKRALITGVTGQDGSILAQQLLNKDYQVFGLIRYTSKINYNNINNVLNNKYFHIVYGDLGDQNSLYRALTQSDPDEVYNLAAMSQVWQSFKIPQYTSNITGIGCLRMLQSVRQFDTKNKIRFYQASSSEQFGKMIQSPANENTPFYPRSPYGVAKTYAHYMTKNYRQSYGMYAVSGILFNHQSERRGPEFVTRKITMGIKDILLGKKDFIQLGNLDAKRDWGYAPKYCFPAKTKILVHKDNKLQFTNIQNIKIGDIVLSWNGTFTCFDKVKETIINKTNKLLKIKFINDIEIKCTEEHPFAVINNGEIFWIKAKNLIENMECLQYNNSIIKIENICNILLQKEIDVFNIQTELYHNYFAQKILVHNCQAMHLMLQQSQPDDYVVATGENHSIRQFLDIAFNYVGINDWSKYVVINPLYFRLAEVDTLVGDASKIKSIGWKYDMTFKELVETMMKYQLKDII